MELHFKISAAQLDTLAENNKAKRMAKSALQSEWLHTYVESSFLLWLPLLSSAAVLYLFRGKFSFESGIAVAIGSVAYYVVWKFYLKNLLASSPNKCAPPMTAIERTIEKSIQHRMTAFEGCYRVLISPEALTLIPPSKKATSIAWSKISKILQDDEFYY